MAQRLLTVQEYIEWTDLLAEAIKVMFAAKGTEETEGTVAYHCAQVRNAITALSAPEEARMTVDLLPAAVNLVTAAERESDVAALFAEFNAAVNMHLGQDLNAWLQTGGLRVSHWWRRGGNTTIAPTNVFPPVTVLGSFAVTGPGAGVFTDSGAVDITRYGGAQIQLEVTGNPIGDAAIGVTCSCRTENGGTVSRTGTIPAQSPVGYTVNLGSASDRIVDLIGITITGGTNGDAFRIKTIEDR